jgi:hypothetical protein
VWQGKKAWKSTWQHSIWLKKKHDSSVYWHHFTRSAIKLTWHPHSCRACMCFCC